MAAYKGAVVMVLEELVDSDDKKPRRRKTRECIKKRRERVANLQNILLCQLFVLFTFAISRPYWTLNPLILPLIEAILYPKMSAISLYAASLTPRFE